MAKLSDIQQSWVNLRELLRTIDNLGHALEIFEVGLDDVGDPLRTWRTLANLRQPKSPRRPMDTPTDTQRT